MDLKSIYKPTKSKILFVGVFFIISLIVVGIILISEGIICYECWYPESTAYTENPILVVLDLMIFPFSPLMYGSLVVDHTSSSTVHFSLGRYPFLIFQILYAIIVGGPLHSLYEKRKKK